MRNYTQNTKVQLSAKLYKQSQILLILPFLNFTLVKLPNKLKLKYCVNSDALWAQCISVKCCSNNVIVMTPDWKVSVSLCLPRALVKTSKHQQLSLAEDHPVPAATWRTTGHSEKHNHSIKALINTHFIYFYIFIACIYRPINQIQVTTCVTVVMYYCLCFHGSYLMFSHVCVVRCSTQRSL